MENNTFRNELKQLIKKHNIKIKFNILPKDDLFPEYVDNFQFININTSEILFEIQNTEITPDIL